MMRKTLALLIILFSFLNALQAQEPITARLAPNSIPNIAPAQFTGGENNFYKYLSDNIKYPPVLIKIKLEGSLDLKFTIDKQGKVKNIEIIRGFDPDADDEVLRVVRTMPAWIPAKENEETVDYIHHLTVAFTLTEGLIEQSEKPVEEPTPETAKTVVPLIAEQPQEDTALKEDNLNHAPKFPGGTEAMEAYFKKNMKYPKRAIEYGIEGRVVFNLEISAEGKISNIRLFKGLFYECNEEAYYLIKKMPDWIPGIKDGKPAAMQVMVPVAFTLPK
ncbi:MAG: TonB family protein [Prevotella sp.]|jgi:TonB family protein|nr:TonB family protein [Prevotella sp.]